MAVPAKRVKGGPSAGVCIVIWLRRIAELWRKIAGGGKKEVPHDVPPGHLAVVVGDSGRRFIIRTSYLNHPIFRQLLDQAYEEYGHNHSGLLALPCNEFLFKEIIHSLGDGRSVSHCFCPATKKETRLSPWTWRDSSPPLFSNKLNIVESDALHLLSLVSKVQIVATWCSNIHVNKGAKNVATLD
uniref:Uncharacterized protein n=1 Tax=Nelumbo nucifera TaxID=4432 RepID=A0A822YGT9_NELNU|nr:TPA_asm: hypothetical protein HUJ06_030156 [Nelumbo nucifera]